MSEVDAMNFTSLSQDLTHSNSPFYMETSNTTSDLPQNEIKNVKKENESKVTHSEEIYSTLDDVLGDVNSGNYSQYMLTRPIDISISSFRQCEPIFTYHQTKAFNDKMLTFQNLISNLPYTEKPELQSHVYNYAKDNNIKEDSFKEENPVETSTSTNEDQLAHECVWQPPGSPSVIHCSRETLKFMEMPLVENAAKESTLNSSQPENFLCKEYLYNDVEKPFYQEDNFNLHDLRANYKREEDVKMIHSNCSPCEEESPNLPDVKTTSQLAFKIHYLLALMARLLTCQDISNPDAEHFKESEKVSDTRLQKLKNFHLKKKNLDEEVINFDSNATKNVRDPTLMGAKLDKYHRLNEELNILIAKLGNLLESKEDHCIRLIEENDKYQKHLGNLINKVTSYEEIIECADQRLKISHSQIAQPRRLENHLKSMTEMPDTSERNGNDLD